MIKLVLHTFFIVLITLSATLAADETARNEAITTVISDQLDAFSKDDEDRAFAHASPSVQLHFDNPGYFIPFERKTPLL